MTLLKQQKRLDKTSFQRRFTMAKGYVPQGLLQQTIFTPVGGLPKVNNQDPMPAAASRRSFMPIPVIAKIPKPQ